VPDQSDVSWHGDNGDVRQLPVGSREPEAVRADLGQPRPELAAAGDKQAEAAFCAQGSLKILGFAEYRGSVTRHF
jgi:hypothetical protein